ncbi:MAG: DUF3305 domain-containing protein [Pseudomonadota bacterium]
MRPPDLSLPVGIVIRRTPGATQWARYAWKAVAVLPGAGPADWQELRREGDAIEYHAATVPLELWRTDTDAYRTALSAEIPTLGIVMNDHGERLEVLLATASPYETQDYLDSGEELVELVPMPPMLVALLRDFIAEHHVEEPFKKRRRDKKRVDLQEDGIGDARIRQTSDVYRAPGTRRRTMH